MLNGIIDFCLRHRFWVVLAVAACAVGGVVSMGRLDIDAFPDTTPVQVQINATAPALNPEEIETQITFPIEQKISGLPRLQQLRSVSKFGLSQVVVTFEDGTDIYFARQLLNERLGTVELPPGIGRPTLGPVSTGLGEIFHYLITSEGYDFSTLPKEQRIQKLTELRTFQDWVVKPTLRTVKGTAEINSWGGYEKQYQVRIDPNRLIKHGLTFDQVVEAIEKNNRNVGGGNIRRGGQMLLVHGVGRTVNVDEIKQIAVVTSREGQPIRVQDVADVQIGHEIRRGAVTADGKGEAVLGLGFMLMGENSHHVTRALQTKLADIQPPHGVHIQTVYDRTELVDHVIDTARTNLFEGGLLVIAILFAFLGRLRAATIVALAIPLSMLCAFSGMLQFGIAASLLSLGAVDFGMVVDSSVVMVENCVRHLAHADPNRRSHREIVRDAAVEVRKPTLYGELIIMIVYLPILTLEGVEGKLFRPMALTVLFALAASMVLSLTLMPVLASLVLSPRVTRLLQWFYDPLLRLFSTRRQARVAADACDVTVCGGLLGLLLIAGRGITIGLAHETLLVLVTPALALLLFVQSFRSALLQTLLAGEEREPVLMRLAQALYAPVLRFTMSHKLIILALTFAVLLVALGPRFLGLGWLGRTGLLPEEFEDFGIAPNLGTEFVPRLSEGAIVLGVVRLAGTDLERSIEENTRIEKAILRAFPEVAHVWSRIGTAEVATDPMGVELTDLFVTLKPREQWQQARLDRIAHLQRQGTNDQALLDQLRTRKAGTQAELTELLERELRDLPGQRIAFSQPIEQRINEMISGVRSDLAVKLFGDDLEVLKAKAIVIQEELEKIPGHADVNVEQVTGQPVLKIKLKQDALARNGVPARAVLDLVESIGSKPLGEVVEGQYRFPLVIRLPENVRASPQTLSAMLVATPSGERIPLERLATVTVVEDSPSTITREWGQRCIVVTCNIRGRDTGSFVAEAQRRINADSLMLQGRYHLEWGGQFENYERARKRLWLVVPLAVLLILVLLFLTYGNVVDALRVFTGVPLGWVGGIIALWLRDMPFSISAAVGFIAMSGVAVLDDMILVSSIRQLRRQGLTVDRAVAEAARTRLRPVLMTTLVASLGLVPMALSTGMGAEVQRPLATVVIGGVLGAMVMSLLVIRVLYVLVDSATNALVWLLDRLFGIRPEQLTWLIGEYREEKSDPGEAGSQQGPAVPVTTVSQT